MTREVELAIRIVELFHDIDPYQCDFREELEGAIDIYCNLIDGDFDRPLEALRYEQECMDDDAWYKEDIQDLINDIEELKKDREGE